MERLARLEGDEGTFMLVELDRVDANGVVRADRAEEIELVADTREVVLATSRLEDSLASVRGAAVALMSTIDGMPKGSAGLALDEVSLELGVHVGVEGGVLVARGSMAANASVTLTWRARGAER